MSLKARLAVTLTIAFLVILTIGSALTFRQATQNIAAELSAARSVANNRVAQLIAELPASRDVPGKLASFVRAFNGDRHVQIMLIDATGAVRDFSQPAQDGGALPAWFVQLLAPEPSVTVMPLSGSALPMTGAVVSIDPRNELADTWTELSVSFAILALFVLIAFVAVWVVADRALRPLDAIQAGFGRIGGGDYATPVEAAGPPEMRSLAAGFNRMASQLDEVSARNRRLSEQLLRLQDEERAELARDLHDEVGPLLFAIDVDASAIARLARRDTPQGPLAERAEAIKQAAHQARREVRRILGGLRPGLLPGLGLKVAVETMLGELARRHPDVAFVADVADGDWGGPTETLLQRVVREAVNNALRHGHPGRIAVHVAPRDGRLWFEIVDDGGGLPAGGPTGGFGLIGMRERIEAASGDLTVTQVALPPGVRLSGSVPLAAHDEARQGGRAA
ncbi:sensor histidine kinase [Aurantimonas sp. HBX-1]|uniref:sensor histidine kinase n=1 Tax=Aurantimonas sp. HBX-1 TaxID=2906072 RepID=UPI001F403240|nr:histidine kinase [Aurantimonas sp. HBX-1]UIJ72256.1 histidine kinase [Aurantimonas sp. HBX-1]